MTSWYERPEDERPARLTRAEFEAGAPCPGCGLGLVEPRQNGRPGTIHETPEQTAERETEQARFRSAHDECHAGGWTVGSGLYTHCSHCCPPHPLSAEQIDAVVAILTTGPRGACE